MTASGRRWALPKLALRLPQLDLVPLRIQYPLDKVRFGSKADLLHIVSGLAEASAHAS